MTKKLMGMAKTNNANEKEIKASTKNLEVINQAIGTNSAVMRLLSDKLLEQYEDGDRRADRLDDAITRLDEATRALETLRDYERETIKLCESNKQVPRV